MFKSHYVLLQSETFLRGYNFAFELKWESLQILWGFSFAVLSNKFFFVGTYFHREKYVLVD